MTPFRSSQRTGRLRLRHLLEHTEARGEEMAEQAPRFHRLAREDSAPRVVSAAQLFQTPPDLAARLVAIASDDGRRELGRVLEPSAGLGRLYRAIRFAAPTNPVVLVDVSPDCCRELFAATEGDSAATLIQADFLTLGTNGLDLFDTVLMNPPFKQATDTKHVGHALEMVRPGGRLVTLCAAGPKQRERLGSIATQWIDLPPGSFRSEGTNVETAIVVIDR